MATSSLFKIVIGIILLLVVCIPEWFKTTDGNSVYLCCVGACFEESSYLSTVVSIICLTQENNTKETATIQNNTVYTVHFSIFIHNSTLYLCEQQRHSLPLFQDVKIPENTTSYLLEVSGNYLVYSEEESHFTLVDIGDRDSSLPFSFEIYVKNTTGLNGTIYDGNFESKGMKNQDDIIKISLQFEHHVPYYKGTLGIIWLSLIPLVFACGLIFVICKVLEEKRTSLMKCYKKESSSFKRCKDKQSRISPKTHCLAGDNQKCGSNKQPRSHSAPALPVIAEHLDTAS